jgi:hypothetical protein
LSRALGFARYATTHSLTGDYQIDGSILAECSIIFDYANIDVIAGHVVYEANMNASSCFFIQPHHLITSLLFVFIVLLFKKKKEENQSRW